MSSSSRRAIAALLMAPLLALAVTASGFVGLRCRMTGMVSFTTCCPGVDSVVDTGADDAEPPAQSSVSEPGCCERVVVANAKPAASPAPSVGSGASEALPVVAFVELARHVRLPTASHAEWRAVPPRLSRPPLQLLKRSLLI